VNVYKLEVMIIDEDVTSIEQAENLIDETRFPNHTNVYSVTCREAEIGEWDDNNPLNSSKTLKTEMERLFPTELPRQQFAPYTEFGTNSEE